MGEDCAADAEGDDGFVALEGGEQVLGFKHMLGYPAIAHNSVVGVGFVVDDGVGKVVVSRRELCRAG